MNSVNLVIVNYFTNPFCDQVSDGGSGWIVIQGSIKLYNPPSDRFAL